MNGEGRGYKGVCCINFMASYRLENTFKLTEINHKLTCQVPS